jgi:hypothetical protein
MVHIPALVASMHPDLYEQAQDHLLDLSYADYFYITSYPTYDGYRIEHDPTITAYCHLTTDEPQQENPTEQNTRNSGNTGIFAVIALIAAIIIIALVVVAVMLRKK